MIAKLKLNNETCIMVNKYVQSYILFAGVDISEQYLIEVVFRSRRTVVFCFLPYLRGIKENKIHVCGYHHIMVNG